MKKRINISGMSLRGMVAGGLLAGAVGLGFGEAGYGGTTGQTGTAGPAAEDQGLGGSQAAGTAAADPAAALPPNVAPGWKIRVCSEKTQAQSINFRVMSADDKAAKSGKTGKSDKRPQDQAAGTGSGTEAAGTANQAGGTGEVGTTDQAAATAASGETASWSKGDPSVINLPASVAQLERIRIEATPAQEDMKSEVCVLYNDHVTKKMSFDGKQAATVKMNDNGTCGC